MTDILLTLSQLQPYQLAAMLGGLVVVFIVAYVMLFIDTVRAALIGWLISMVSRQSGHFFFEPRGYDHINQVTDEYKEEIKVGFNIHRKIVLMGAWVVIPAVLWFAPSVGGLIEPATSLRGTVHDVGMAWFALGVVGLLFRTVQLFFLKGVMEGVAWATKILTDPFHDVLLYWRAPLHLLKGELLDPMEHVRGH